MSGCFVAASDDFLDPGAEGGDFGVDARGALSPAGVAPGGDPINHPPPSAALAHQWPTTVATATVHAPLWMSAAGTEHAACECAVEMLLAVATGEQGERSLLEGLGVRTT